MRLNVLIVVLTLLVVSVVSAQDSFTSLDGRFSFTVPSGWEVEESVGFIILSDDDRNELFLGMLNSNDIELAREYYADTLDSEFTADTLFQLLADATPEINANIEAELGVSFALPGTTYEGPVEIAGYTGAAGAFGMTPVIVLEAETGDFLVFRLEGEEGAFDTMLESLLSTLVISPFSFDAATYTTPITAETAPDVTLVTQYNFSGGTTHDVEFLPDGQSFVVLAGGRVQHIDLATADVIKIFDAGAGLVRTMDISSDGSLVAGALIFRDDPDVTFLRIWDAATGEELNTIMTNSDSDHPELVRFSPDGSLVGVVADGLFIHEVATGDEFLVIDTEREAVTFNGDGTRLAATCPERPGKLICIYDVASGEVLTEILNPDRIFPIGYRSLASAGDHFLVGFSQNNDLAPMIAFSWETGEVVFTAEGIADDSGRTNHEDEVGWIALDTDESLAVTIGGEDAFRLWDAATGAGLSVQPDAHGFSIVNRAAISPDGTLLFTTANDGTVRVWAVESGS